MAHFIESGRITKNLADNLNDYGLIILGKPNDFYVLQQYLFNQHKINSKEVHPVIADIMHLMDEITAKLAIKHLSVYAELGLVRNITVHFNRANK